MTSTPFNAEGGGVLTSAFTDFPHRRARSQIGSVDPVVGDILRRGVGSLIFSRRKNSRRTAPDGDDLIARHTGTMAPTPLSDLEVLALAAVMQLGPEAYGVSIREEIRERTGRSVSVGSLYKAIHRLEERGYVSTVVGEPTAVRGGRAKKHVQLEPAGRAALEESVRALGQMLSGLGMDLGAS